MRQARQTHPQAVYTGLGGITVQPLTVGVPRWAIHYGPADAAGLIDLETEIIVSSGDGVVMLVDDEVGAAGAAGL